MAIADNIAVMRAGKIEQMGAYAELRAKPANTFVAGTWGHYPMNLLRAVVNDASLIGGANAGDCAA